MPSTKYVEGVVGQPESFFPDKALTSTDKTISRLIYRGLFKYNIYGVVVPDLADSWSITDDGIIYTIIIKDDQYWSDGTKITSDDLIYTAYKSSILSDVATDKVNDLTVRYTLPNKFSPFLSLLTDGVMQAGSEENYNPLMPVSSGPFRVLRIEKTGAVIRSVALLNQSEGKVKQLVFRYYSSEDELATAARLGEIHGFVGQKNHTVDSFMEYKFPLQGVYYALFFNLRNEKLQDIELRQDLGKVLPIEEIILAKGIFVQGAVSRSPFTSKSLNFEKYDPDYTNDYSAVSLELAIPNTSTHVEVASSIAKYWEDKLGINVVIKRVDPERIVGDVIKNRSFEVLLYGQEVGRDPDRYVYWHSTQKDFPNLNLSGFEHVRVDRALEEGRKEVDSQQRVTHYNAFQETINDEVPAIFLYHPYAKYFVNKYVEGMGEKYTFNLSDRFLDFQNWHFIETN